jgi:hypothetical protein
MTASTMFTGSVRFVTLPLFGPRQTYSKAGAGVGL